MKEGLSARWTMLTANDLHRLAIGKVRIRKFVEHIQQEIFSPHKTEPCRDCCLSAREGYIESWTKELVDDSPDILSLLDAFVYQISSTENRGACILCSEELAASLREKREDIWKSLKSVFNLA